MSKRKHVADDEVKNKRKKKKIENIENIDNLNCSNDEVQIHTAAKLPNNKSLIRNVDDLDGDFCLDRPLADKIKKKKKPKSKTISDKVLNKTGASSDIAKSIKTKNNSGKSNNHKSVEDISDTDYLKESISEKLSKSQSRKKRKRITDILAKKGPCSPKPSDFIDEISKYFKDKLTTLELESISINESNIGLCNDLTHTPISFLKSLFPKWKKTIKNCIDLPRRPLLLVVCPSGIRCVQYIRAISEFKIEGCKIAKLFAKHIKVEEQHKFLLNNAVHIAVGTPNRLHYLLQNGDLSLDHIKYVVVDWTHRDGKQLRLIDQDQMKQDFMLLLQKNILCSVVSQQFKIALF